MPTVSYDITAGQATRIQAAVGKILNLRDGSGLPRAATAAEARAYHIQLLKDAVRNVESQADAAAALAAVSPPADLAIA